MRKLTPAILFVMLVAVTACTFAPTILQSPAVLPQATAVGQFSAALKDLAGPFGLALLTDKAGSIDYQAMEQAGSLRVFYDAQGLPALFAVTRGRFALRQDIPQYLADGTDFINKYDQEFLAHLRAIKIAAFYYSQGVFNLVPNGGASNQFLSAGRDPDHYYGDYNPSYYGTILINRQFIFDGSWGFGDRNDLFAVAVILHEVGRMEGRSNSSLKNTDEYTYEYSINWLSHSGLPSTSPDYQMLRDAFDAQRVTQ